MTQDEREMQNTKIGLMRAALAAGVVAAVSVFLVLAEILKVLSEIAMALGVTHP